MSFLKTTAIQHLNGSTPNINLDSSGNVGIGTSTPGAKFHIKTTTGIPARFETNSAYNYLQFANTSSQEVGWMGYGSSDQNIFGIYNTRPGDMRFGNNGATRLTIDSSGRVTMPYQPYFYAARGAGNVTGPAVFVCGSVYTNVGGNYNSSTGRFTAPVAGTYEFTSFMLTNGGSNRCQWQIRKNDSALALGEMSAGTAWQNGCITVILTLAVNDYVDVYVSSSGDVAYGSGYNGFTGKLLG